MSFRSTDSTHRELPQVPSNEAAATILDQHEKSVRHYISGKLGSDGAGLVSDIWQEVAIAAHRHCFETQAIDDSLNWLRRIASNKIADHWRSAKRAREADAKWAENRQGASLQGSLEWVLHQSSRDRVREVLASLDSEQHRLLREKYFEGYTVAEIATRTGLGEKVIEHRLAKARAAFRDRLSRETE